MNMKLAGPWRCEEGRWIRSCGTFVVAQATDWGWYVLRTEGSGGISGSAQTALSARRRADDRLLRDGWELTF